MKLIFALGFYCFCRIATAAPEDLTILREQAREVVKVITCGGCHTPGLSSAKPGALKIYNLHAPYWTATMSDRQLTDFKRRIVAQDSSRATPRQIQILSNFIDKEISNRAQDPTERFRQLQETKYPDFYKVFSSGVTLE